MKFKVGDRVEVLSGPAHVDHPEAIGPGTVEYASIDESFLGGESYRVAVDAVSDYWFYSRDQLRPLDESSVVEIEIGKPQPKVGDHVRLTGVVVSVDFDGGCNLLLTDGRNDTYVSVAEAGHLEIIRQPFKRGEVVWVIGERMTPDTHLGPYIVVKNEDEDSGDLFVVGDRHGDEVFCGDPYDYERRP
jgi:hypothetical protein